METVCPGNHVLQQRYNQVPVERGGMDVYRGYLGADHVHPVRVSANGKSTFLNTIMYVLGDYAITTPTETFMKTTMPLYPCGLYF
jgi:hypothetical protein